MILFILNIVLGFLKLFTNGFTFLDITWVFWDFHMLNFLQYYALWVLFLAPSQFFQGCHKWPYISSEVVIPQKETYLGKEFQPKSSISNTLEL